MLGAIPSRSIERPLLGAALEPHTTIGEIAKKSLNPENYPKGSTSA